MLYCIEGQFYLNQLSMHDLHIEEKKDTFGKTLSFFLRLGRTIQLDGYVGIS